MKYEKKKYHKTIHIWLTWLIPIVTNKFSLPSAVEFLNRRQQNMPSLLMLYCTSPPIISPRVGCNSTWVKAADWAVCNYPLDPIKTLNSKITRRTTVYWYTATYKGTWATSPWKAPYSSQWNSKTDRHVLLNTRHCNNRTAQSHCF